MKPKNDLSLFKSKVYSVVDASLLSCGVNPKNAPKILNARENQRPEGFYEFFSQLSTAVQVNELHAIRKESWDEYNEEYAELDWYQTTVNSDDIKKFYKNHGLNDQFFNPLNSSHMPPYMNPKHPFYSKELHAAIELWENLHNDPDKLLDNTPSEALEELSQGIGEKFDLGTRAKERIVITANWKQKGRQKKYGQNSIEEDKKAILEEYPLTLNTGFEFVPEEPKIMAFGASIDDDIPF